MALEELATHHNATEAVHRRLTSCLADRQDNPLFHSLAMVLPWPKRSVSTLAWAYQVQVNTLAVETCAGMSVLESQAILDQTSLAELGQTVQVMSDSEMPPEEEGQTAFAWSHVSDSVGLKRTGTGSGQSQELVDALSSMLRPLRPGSYERAAKVAMTCMVARCRSCSSIL